MKWASTVSGVRQEARGPTCWYSTYGHDLFYYGVKKGSTAVAIRDTRQPFWIALDNLSLHGLYQLNALLWVPTWEPWRIHTSHSGCVLHVYHKRDYKYIYLIAINQIHGWPSTQPGTCTQPCPIVHTAVPPLFTQPCPGRTMNTAVCIYVAGLCASCPTV